VYSINQDLRAAGFRLFVTQGDGRTWVSVRVVGAPTDVARAERIVRHAVRKNRGCNVEVRGA
jgi:hypothetical protein